MTTRHKISFENLTAESGEVIKDFISIEGLKIPVIIINGKNDGSSLIITAGIHGSEYNAVLTAYQIIQDIKLDKLNGSVVVLPIVNLPAFQQRAESVCPIDNKNMNRIFPGDEKGSISERIANLIIRNVDNFDYIIDIHCGDLIENISSYVSLTLSGNKKVDEISIKMAESFGFPLIVSGSGIEGALTSTVVKMGIPAIVAESGGMGVADQKSIDKLVRGIKQVMASFGLLSFKTERKNKYIVMHNMNLVESDCEGIFYPLISPGQLVSKGDEIGIIKTYLGDIKQKILSPYYGIPFLVRSIPPVSKGDLIFVIASK
jgi:predicted deacylase